MWKFKSSHLLWRLSYLFQADLKAIMACGAFGTTAVTALTAQNTHGVHGVHAVPIEFLEAQVRGQDQQ